MSIFDRVAKLIAAVCYQHDAYKQQQYRFGARIEALAVHALP
jgi:hypothetical protein